MRADAPLALFRIRPPLGAGRCERLLETGVDGPERLLDEPRVRHIVRASRHFDEVSRQKVATGCKQGYLGYRYIEISRYLSIGIYLYLWLPLGIFTFLPILTYKASTRNFGS